MQVKDAQKEPKLPEQDAPIPLPQSEPAVPEEEPVKVMTAAATVDTAPATKEAPTMSREKTPEGVKPKKEVKILEVPQTLEGKSAEVTEDEEEEEEVELPAVTAVVPKPEDDEEEEEEDIEIPVRPPTPPKSKVSSLPSVLLTILYCFISKYFNHSGRRQRILQQLSPNMLKLWPIEWSS